MKLVTETFFVISHSLASSFDPSNLLKMRGKSVLQLFLLSFTSMINKMENLLKISQKYPMAVQYHVNKKARKCSIFQN
jgi:hypothetical protein